MAVTVFRLQVADKVLHVVDVIIQVKSTIGQRHRAGIFPVGDVDLVVFEHGLDCIAQQRRVVARQRGNNQHSGLALELGQRGRIIGEALEAPELTKRLVDFNSLVNGDIGPFNIQGLNVKCWLFVVFSQSVHQAVTGGHALGKRVLPHS